jgi:hypothetical protein
VAELVAEVASASDEQARGIEQVNTAVAQMDQVTQSNAANAEESASASEELSAQAHDLTDVVEALAAIVGGTAMHTRSNGNGGHARFGVSAQEVTALTNGERSETGDRNRLKQHTHNILRTKKGNASLNGGENGPPGQQGNKERGEAESEKSAAAVRKPEQALPLTDEEEQKL